MRAADQYPVFERWCGFLDWILNVTEKYPKSARFTLATRTANHSLDVLEALIDAIYTKDRMHILKQINLYIEKIRILIRIAYRRTYLSSKQYEYASGELAEIGSMVGGWIKATRRV